MSIRRIGLGASLMLSTTLALVAPLAGQVNSTSSPRGLGMGGAYGAVARGVSAGPLNPAMLGLPDNPGFSLALPAVAADAGSEPISWRDVTAYDGKLIPDQVKRGWLDRIPSGGNLSLAAGVAVQPIGISIGRIALHVSGIAGGNARLPRDAVALLLFGNADSADQGGTYSLDNGKATGFAATSAGLSAGWQVAHLAGGSLTLGATGKVVFGLGFVGLRGSTGSVSATPIAGDIRFPTVTVSNDSRPLDDRGYGFDLGIAWQSSRLTLGLAVSDVVNSFRWNTNDARIRDGRVFFNADSTTSSFTDRHLNDPALDTAVVRDARSLLADARFRPTIRASAALDLGGHLLLAAEGYHVTGGLMGPDLKSWSHGAVGAEWRWLGGLLPLRAGAGLASDGGFDWSVGTGLDFAPFNVNAAYGEMRPSAGGTVSRVSVGLGFGRGR